MKAYDEKAIWEAVKGSIQVDPAVPQDMILVIGSTPHLARREGSFLDMALQALEDGRLTVLRNIGTGATPGKENRKA